jgi:hypothetical protein
VDFVLGPGGTLIGRVRDEVDGTPVAGAEVLVHVLPNGGFDPVTVSTAETDALGRYRFEAIAPGTFRLSVRGLRITAELYRDVPCMDDHYDCVIENGHPVAVARDATTTADFDVARQRYLQVGISLAGGGAPSYSKDLDLLDTNGVLLQSFSLSSDGGEAGPVPVGTYKLRLRTDGETYNQLYAGIDCLGDCLGQLPQATPVNVRVEDQSVPVQFTLTRLPQISGRVTDAGSGQPLADVFVQTLGPHRNLDVAWTDAAGEFALEAIPSGQLYLHFRAPFHVDELHANVACTSGDPLRFCSGGQARQWRTS